MTIHPFQSSSLPPHLFDFVDRTNEVQRFTALLEDPQASERERILIFHGPTGIGKTLLLDRIEHECSLRSIPMARISFEGGLYNNYLRILRTIRDGLGAKHFGEWTELVNYYYARSTDVTLHIENPSTQSQVNVNSHELNVNGNIVGRDNIEIRDNFIVVPRADVDPLLIQDTLTDKFLDSLDQFVQSKPIVLLFDSVDHADFDQLTANWLWQSIVERASKLQGCCLIPIITLIQKPHLERALDVFTKQFKLKPLSREHIIEYLRRRDVPPDRVPGATDTILVLTDSRPASVAEAAEKILELLAQEGS